MKERDILEVEIIDDSINGDGIAKVDSRIIFVPYTSKGDKVKIEILKINKSQIKARVIKLLEPSIYRKEVKCPIYRSCGGCCLLHHTYLHQIEIKKLHVENNLRKIAKIDKKVDKVVFCDEYRYRNKIQLPIGKNKDGKIIVGYYKKNSHEIVEQKSCLLSKKEHEKIINIFLEFANKEKLTVYNEEKHEGLLRHIMIRQLADIPYLTIVINGNTIKNLDKLYNLYLNSDFNNISINLCINKEKTNVILTDTIKNIYGNKLESAVVLQNNIFASQKSFMQINSKVRDILYTDIIELIKEKKIDNLIECFSGVGILANVLAKHIKRIYSIEIEKKAVFDANMNKLHNNNENITNILGDANIELGNIVEKIKNFSLLIDPPRKGVEKSFINVINENQPEFIIYVSCDSSTLARDIFLLNNYEVEKLYIYDMFPGTQHVEAIVLLSKLDSKKYISVELTMDDIDLTSIESKAIYKQIQNYVLEKFRFKVSTLYIAQVKKKHGLEVREHYNIPKNENQKVPQCPIEKEEAILDALKHFKML